MIAKAGILIVLLSSDGHWFGSSHETVAFQWAVLSGAPDTQIEWTLDAGPVTVARGRRALQGNRERRDDKPVAEGVMIAIDVPAVRVETDMTFRYRARDTAANKVIQEGQVSVHVYPADLLAAAAARLHGREVYLWDAPKGLPSLFKKAKIAHTVFNDPQQLQFVRPDILIVAAGQITRRPEVQSKLVNLAAAGTGVLLLEQASMSPLGGFALVPRKPPAKLNVLDDHPLMRHLDRDTLVSQSPIWALELPTDATVLPIAWWPREYPSQRPPAVDAIVASQSIGRGRIVYCQYPLGPWQRDPRSQLFLDDALDYLASPIGPTTVAAAASTIIREGDASVKQNDACASHQILLPGQHFSKGIP